MSRRDRPAKRWLRIQPGAQGSDGAPVPTYSISGEISGTTGVTVTLSGDANSSVVTDSTYEFTDLPAGNYTITPTKLSYTFSPTSTAVEIVDASDTGNDFSATFVQIWPLVQNFEGETVGDTGLVLEATSRHNNMIPDAGTVQLDDYSTIPAIQDNRFTNCFQGDASAYVASEILVAANDGFTPADDQTMVVNAVFWATGTGSQTDFYIRDTTDQEGININMLNNGNMYLRTMTGGSWTNKLGPVLNPLGSSVHQNSWHSWSFEYNFATNAVRTRVIKLGTTAPEQTDGGWQSMGTVVSPTFNQNIELRKCFAGVIQSSVIQGLAQVYWADASDGYCLGTAKTHNYQAP